MLRLHFFIHSASASKITEIATEIMFICILNYFVLLFFFFFKEKKKKKRSSTFRIFLNCLAYRDHKIEFKTTATKMQRINSEMYQFIMLGFLFCFGFFVFV